MNDRQRIEKLERRCQLLTVLFGGTVVMMIAGGFAAEDGTGTKLRASGLEIVDKDGKVRMELSRGDDDNFGLIISNAKGAPERVDRSSSAPAGLNSVCNFNVATSMSVSSLCVVICGVV